MTNLTAKEIQVLRNNLNYSNRADQLSDNFSDSTLTEDARSLGVTTNVIRGVYLSLSNKELGHVVERDSEVDTYFQLSEKGINTIFDYILEV